MKIKWTVTESDVYGWFVTEVITASIALIEVLAWAVWIGA